VPSSSGTGSWSCPVARGPVPPARQQPARLGAGAELRGGTAGSVGQAPGHGRWRARVGGGRRREVPAPRGSWGSRSSSAESDCFGSWFLACGGVKRVAAPGHTAQSWELRHDGCSPCASPRAGPAASGTASPGWGLDGWLPRAGRVGRGARGVGGVRVWQQVTLGRLLFLPSSQPAGAAEVALQAQPPLREPPKADARGRRGGHQGTAWIFPRVVPGSALPPPPFPAPALRSPATSPGGCSGGQGDVTAPAGWERWQQGCPGSLTGCAESSCRSRGSCPGLGLDWAHWEHPTRPQRLFPGDRRCLCLRRLPRWPREPGWGCCSKRVARGALPGSLLGDHRAGESCLGKKLRAPD